MGNPTNNLRSLSPVSMRLTYARFYPTVVCTGKVTMYIHTVHTVCSQSIAQYRNKEFMVQKKIKSLVNENDYKIRRIDERTDENQPVGQPCEKLIKKSPQPALADLGAIKCFSIFEGGWDRMMDGTRGGDVGGSEAKRYIDVL